MNKEFQMLRKKQRFGLRKLNIGLVSVLLGFTIFGYNLASQAPVAHAATSTVTTASAGSGVSGSLATEVASGSQGSNSQAASATSSAATASQATPATQVPAPAASQSSAPANSGNATSSPASQAGTTSANHTASNTNTTPSSQTMSVNETTSSATQARTLMMKFPAAQSRILMTNLAVRNLNTADDLPKSVQPSGTDTTLPTTTQTYTKVDQPLLFDYLLHTSGTGTRDRDTWVDKTVARGVWDYPSYTLDTIFGKTSKPGIITSNPDKYFFAAYVDYSEQYHRVILLARGQDPSDKNLYSYTIHTYSQNNSTTTTKPGESIKEQYTGAGGSTHDLFFQNYGDSFSVKLIGRLKDGYGLLPVFDEGLLDPTYGSNTLDQNDAAAKAKSISFWASAIPQKTSTKVRYVDQATGKDIVQPMEISGFGYQGFKVKGDAPTVKGYHLVSKPEFLPSTNKASTYEDGTISPYKVGQTYDLALSDSVVIKQTVINTDGTVRATPYYKGSPLTNASKVLGRESYNDHMSFGTPDSKFYTYTNRIGQVDDSYIYYYAKDSDPKGSEMRLHFIDVTGVNNSYYAPSDGPELDADKQTIHGNIGENYSFTYAVPKGYDQVGTSDVTGTYSVTHHDAYVYVKANTPKPVTTPVTTNENTTLTDEQAKAGIANNSELPDGTTYTWSKQPDTTQPGDTTGEVTVKYPGGTSASVTVPVHVNSEAETNQPEVSTPTVDQNGTVDPNSVVTNQDTLPKGTTYSWKTTPDTSKAGQPATGSLHVAYPDGSSEDVPVTVNVKSNADQYKPEVSTPTVDQNGTVDPNSVVTNQDTLPKGTTYSWKTTPDTSKAGQPATGSLHVAYPDGSSEDVPVTVNVKSNADQYKPEVSTPTVDQNGTVDPNSVVTNQDTLPKGTTYSWKTTPDTSKAGQPATGSLHVAYPDGSSEDVPVTVNVKSNADQYKPEVSTPTVDQNGTVDPNSVVTNQDTLPKGTTYSWKTTPDTSKAGQPATGSLHVAYPDGSSEDVPVTVNVKSNADQYKPEVSTPTVDQNGTVDPNSVVTNQDTLPKGTTYSWKTTPDTSKAGQPATGSLHVAYPDGSSEDVPVTVNVKSNADQYKPEVSTPTVDQNGTVDPNSVVTNQDTLPKGTTYSWKTTPDTSKAGQPATGSLHVAYPDGSSEDVPVTVNVKSNADQYKPEVSTPTVDQNGTVDPNSVVTNQDTLPKGTTYSWKTTPDTSKAGQPATGSLHVAYPDGSSEDVPVTVNVKSNADQYKPEVSTPTVDQNGTVDPNSVVTNQDTLPKGTTYSWKTTPDTSKAGQPATGSLHVAYPDGSSEDVPVTVNVKSNADQYKPEVSTPTVDQNGTVDPNSVVTNQDTLPKGTTYSWKTTPDTSKAGQPATGSLHVAYPDGSSEDVPVTVNVKSNADQYKPEVSTPTVDQNGTVDPNSVVTNQDTLPKGTTYSWKTTPDTSKAGQPATGSLHVAYPDGSSEDVPVTVNVKSNADQYKPEVSTPTVDQNGTVDPNSVVTNQDTLPKGTTYSWKTTPDTSKAGQPATGSLHVAYPDGSSEDVPVTVNVKSNADQYKPEVSTPTVDQNGTVDPNSVVTNQDTLPKGTTYSWKTTPDTSKAGQPATGSLHVAYPDGSSEDVPVTVNVKSNADQYKPEVSTPTVDQNGTVDPNSVVTNQDTLPKGTTYSWKTTPDTSKAGQPATGSLHVAYPDGSSEDVPVTVNVKSNADQYKPEVSTPTVDQNGTVDPNSVVTNQDTLPKGTTYSWKTTPDTSKAGQPATGSLHVAYPDGSSEDVPVTVNVKSNADQYKPEVSTPTVDQNGTVDPNSVVTNQDTLPKGTTYSWKTTPDTSKAGQPATGSLHVAYPDGSSEDVPVTVNVKSNADQYKPEVSTPTVDQNGTVDPNSVVTNQDTLPKGTTYSWKTTPDTSKAGQPATGSLHVAYPDGSSEDVPVTVNVKSNADQYKPEVSTPTVDQNGTVDPNSVVTNQDTLPKGTTYSWKTTPDTSKAGQPATGSLHVAYPDGSSEDVPVTVNVKSNADQYKPEVSTPTVDQNGTVDPNSVVTNQDTLPKGTTYSWKTTPDTSKAGQPATGSLHVAYPDGSSEDVPVTVNVKSNADQYKPEVSTPTVDQNGTVDPNSVVTNQDTLPKGTTYSWKTTPDTSKAGQPATGSLHVAYPDGSSEDVPVTVNVKSNADQYKPEVSTPTVDQNGTVDPNSVVTNQDTLPKGTTYSWKTTPDTSKAGQPATGSLHVAYPDGSSEDVPVTVNVKSNADQYKPEVSTPTVDQNGTVDPNSVVTNQDTLPKGTTYSWKTTPDTSKAGQPATGSLHVAYPDGSSEDVPVTVNVKSNADQYKPEVSTPTVDQNGTVDPNSVVTNQDTLPKGTTYSWKTTPDTSKAGQPATGSLHVAYPDGSSEDVPVTVNVKSNADQYKPEVSTPTVDQNGTVDPNSVVTNQDTLPKGTTYSWKTTPDTSKAGQPATGSLHVAYPDGSSEDVPVTVNVKSNADQYKPEVSTPTVDQNGTVDPNSVVTNQDTLPKGTTYSWKTTPDTSKAGQPATGSLHVAYPDGSSEDVPVTVNVKSNADQYKPEVSTPTVDQNGTVDPNSVVTNQDTLPKGTTYSWKTTPDTSKAGQPATGSLHVAYPDGSSEDVPVTVNVKSNADQYKPEVSTPTVDQNGTVDPNSVVTNQDTLPKGTTYSWKTTPDTSKAGQPATGSLHVAYPDGSSEDVPVTVNVKSNADQYKPEVSTPTVDQNGTVDPNSVVTNQDTLPKGTTYSWKTTPDTSKAGQPATGSLHVAYPDGSSEDVPVTVNVKSNADQYKPEVSTPTVDQNGTVDPNSVVTNQDTLPKGTTYSWKTTPDTSKAGQPATGSLHVAYPDGSSEDVPVTVNVKSNADQYKPEVSTPTVDQNGTVDPNSVVTNQDTLPKGTTYSWKTTPDTSKAGQPATGSLHVAYPDGSSEDVPVTVNVKSNADQYKPEVSTPTVDQNGTVDPNSVVTNQDTLPKGTTYSWKTTPDTSKAGQPATGSLHVAYPDGSSEDVPVTVNVKSNADQYKPEVSTPTVDQNGTVDPNSVVTNQDTLPKGTTYSWKTTPDTSKAGQPATGSLHVAYPDGSSEDVPVTVNVKSNADQYKPEVSTPTVDQNGTVDPNSVVTNQDTLPKGTTYSWKTTPDTSKAGQPATGSLHVAYPDGSSEDVPVTVNVKSNADQYKPEVSTPTVDQNGTVDPNSVVTNQDTLPKGTTYSWKTTPDTSKAGQPATGSLHVAYPDGSSEDVPVTVNVKSNADQYKPEVSTPTVDQNGTVDPNSVVTNQDTLPKGTTYSWKTTPDTSKAGQPATGSLHVAYPDGSSEDVPVTVNVKSNADQYKPEVSTPTVDQNGTVDPNSVVTNQDTLPKGTTYSWKTTPDTSKAGQPATGSLHVAYPDGSSEDVPVTVNVKSNADQYKPEVSTPTVDQNGTVDPNSVVTNQDTLPKGTTYSWKTTPDTSKAGQPATGSLHVAYPDGSSEDVPVTVNVKSNADQYKPEVSTPTVDQNGTVDPNSVVTNQDTLPKGTTYSWKTTPDTSKAGQPATGSLHVAYPDGSSEDVPVTVNVKSNADQYKPEVSTPTVDQNGTVDPNSVVTNQDTLPKGTTYSWKTTPDTSKAGQPATGSLHVAYPDGSSEDVPVTVNVKSNADQYKPEVSTPTVDQNGTVDPNSVVTNQDTLPKGTTYSWKTTPDTSKAGQPATGSLHVAYPDGSSEDVPVTVNVKSNADQYKPEVSTPTVDQNGTVDPNSVVTNQDTLPKGTTYSWKTTPDTSKAGQPATGSLHVAYPDGSSEDVPVTVNVKSNADQYKPEVSTPTVDQNGTVDPNSVVTNQDTLPKGTTYSWKTTPDTSKAGQPATGSLHVAYPDGSSEDVPVTVNVKSNADQYKPEVSTPTVDQNGTVDPNSVVTNQDTLPKGTTYSWKTTPDTSKAGQPATGSLHVAYPDGSSEDVPVTVNVKSNADQYKPEVSTPTVDQNGTVDPNSVVTNQDTLPKGTTYSWKTTPDTSKAGQPATGSLHVAYPDGSSEDVPVTVNVKSNADQYKPEVSTPTVDQNGTVDPNSVVTNQDTLPKGTTYSWKTTPDTSKAGQPATGSLHVAYPDGSSEDVPVTVNVKSNADQYKPEVSTPTVDQNGTVDPNSVVTNQDTLPKGTTYSWKTTPDTSKAGQPATGSLHVAYPDGSSEDVPVTVNVKSNADQYKPTPVTTPVKTNENTTLTAAQAQAAIANNADLPAGTTYTWSKQPDTKKYGDTTGVVTVTYPDGTSEPVTVPVHVNSDAQNYPIHAGNPVKVDNPANLTEAEKGSVKDAITQSNPTAPIKSISVNNDGRATVTYQDGSTTTLQPNVTKLTDADKHPLVPGNPIKVTDPSHLSAEEKGEVTTAIKQANPTAPIKSVAVNDDGSTTVTYQDGSLTTMPANTMKKTDADNYPLVPAKPVTVTDPTHLTATEKGQVSAGIKAANPTAPIKHITVNDDGSAVVTYQDGSTTTVPSNVTPATPTPTPTEADTTTLKPGRAVSVADPSHLTEPEKEQVSAGIKAANPTAPIKSITVNDDGSATVIYQDGSLTMLPANIAKKTDADQYPLVPAKPVTVTDPTHLTATEKGQVSVGIKTANPTAPIKSITVNDDGSATVIYQDGSLTMLPANIAKKTDADQYPLVPAKPVTVTDPTHLTATEKGQVSVGIKTANPTAPIKSITVNDDGSATVIYQDGSLTMLPANIAKKTDADQYPLVPAKPVTVTDPTHLTATEKGQVSVGIKTANPTAPIKSITVNDDGSATVTYQDGSLTMLPANIAKKTDADQYPLVPAKPVTVTDPTHLTATEKGQVSVGIKTANPTAPIKHITVNDDGSAVVTYQDGSTTTVPSNVTKQPATDAERTPAVVPTQKVPVADPSHLSDAEKATVKDHVAAANPTATVTVADDGTATLTYQDGSTHTIVGAQLLVIKPSTTTTADQVTPIVPSGKVPVTDPSHLSDAEKATVKDHVATANQGNFPAGTTLIVADDGTVTITYPDGSVTTLAGSYLVATKPAAGDQTTAVTTDGNRATQNGQATSTAQLGRTSQTKLTTSPAKSQAKTLPQTGNEQGSLLAASGLGMLLLGMLGLGGKRKKED